MSRVLPKLMLNLILAIGLALATGALATVATAAEGETTGGETTGGETTGGETTGGETTGGETTGGETTGGETTGGETTGGETTGGETTGGETTGGETTGGETTGGETTGGETTGGETTGGETTGGETTGGETTGGETTGGETTGGETTGGETTGGETTGGETTGGETTGGETTGGETTGGETTGGETTGGETTGGETTGGETTGGETTGGETTGGETTGGETTGGETTGGETTGGETTGGETTGGETTGGETTGGEDVCELDVSKTCLVQAPPSSGDDCQGKVIEAVFEYVGGDCSGSSNTQNKATCSGDPGGAPVSIVVTRDASKVSASPSSAIALGDLVSFTHSDGKLASNTEFNVDGLGGTQSLEIHTSCSQPLNVGDQFGSMRLSQLTTTEGGTVMASPPAPTSVCQAVRRSDFCDKDDKPDMLTWEYTGGGCAASDNDQGSKAKCSGSINDALAILVNPEKGPDFSVNPGEQFDLSPLDASKKIELANGGGKEKLEIHTSCSQPLNPGDVFGSLTLVAVDGQGLGADVDYSYKIDNIGSTDVFNVTVIDDTISPVPGSPIASIAPGGSVTLTATDTLFDTTTNIVTVTGESASGLMCGAMASATVEVVDPPGSCEDGKPRELVFQYLGGDCSGSSNSQKDAECSGDPGGAPVSVSVTRDTSKVSASPSSGIPLGGTFSITTTESKLASNTEFDVDGPGGTQSLKIHTSCSQPLSEGDRFGSVLLLQFVPEN